MADDEDDNGPRLIVIVPLLIGVLLVVGGLLLAAGLATDLLGVPEATAVENEFAGVNESTTLVDSTVTVRNPNPVTVSIESVDLTHSVYANGSLLGTGQRQRLDLPQGNSTVEVRTAVSNDRFVDWWVNHVRRGEVTNLTVEAGVESTTLDRTFSRTVVTRTVRTDVLSAFQTDRTIPIEADVSIVSGPVLYVNRTSARWASVTDERMVIEIDSTLYNPTAFDVPLESATYDVAMNGIAVANGSAENASTIPAGSTATLRARLVVDNDRLDEWWPSHVERNQTTRVRVDPTVSVDLSRFGRGSRTFDPPPIERTFETDVFGDFEGFSGA